MSEVTDKAKLAKEASRELNRLTAKQKDAVILAMADQLIADSELILNANHLDISAGEAANMSKTLLDRLSLNNQRLIEIAQALRVVAALPDPANQLLWQTERPNGLKIKRISVPMGVIGMIYESRPNVTADAAALCLKAGSAVVLRGGSDASNSNQAIVSSLRKAIGSQGVTPEVVQLIESDNRDLVGEMLRLNNYLDLLIPRGGAGLIQRVVQEATVPVIETGVGNCHIYVDKAANLDQAAAIVVNAKTQRPSVCNAAETVLVHSAIAADFLPKLIATLHSNGVVVHGCPIVQQYSKDVVAATDTDWSDEYLSLDIAIKVVNSVNDAVEHIYRYGTKHTEAIISEDQAAIDFFSREIDASAVIVNASTRFTDGGEFGFGCEIGISTQKLHARGPMGLPEIMSYKYIVEGSGQIRG